MGFLAGAFFFIGVKTAGANMNQIKIYKKTFPGSAPKCINCHVDKLPRKDDGKHDLGAYGLRVKDAGEEISEESYKKVGAIDAFVEE
jgi:hypothetical protein